MNFVQSTVWNQIWKCSTLRAILLNSILSTARYIGFRVFFNKVLGTLNLLYHTWIILTWILVSMKYLVSSPGIQCFIRNAHWTNTANSDFANFKTKCFYLSINNILNLLIAYRQLLTTKLFVSVFFQNFL